MDILASGKSLTKEQKLVSKNGEYELAYSGGGFEVRRVNDGKVIVRISGGAKAATSLKMQEDGNLVLLAPIGGGRPDVLNNLNSPVWMTGTSGSPGAYAKVRNDGRLVVLVTILNPSASRGTPTRARRVWMQPPFI